MYCPRQSTRQNVCHHRCDDVPSMRGSSNVRSTRAVARRGIAATELLLIILVPCFCLWGWSLFDKEFTKSLLAGPSTDTAAPANPVYAILPVGDGVFVTLHSQGQLRFWDQNRSTALGDLQSHLTEIRCGAFSASKNLLAVGSAMGSLEVWDLDQPDRPVTSRIVDKIEVSSCQFTPDGSRLVCADEAGRISVWDPRTLRRLSVTEASRNGDAIRCLNISSDGKLALAGTRSGTVQVWDLSERKLIRTIRLTRSSNSFDSCIEAVATLPGSREFVAATRTDGIIIGNYETGKVVRQFASSFMEIRSGMLSANGRFFVSGNNLGQLGVWDVATGKSLQSIKQYGSMVRAVACSSNANTILFGDWAGEVSWH